MPYTSQVTDLQGRVTATTGELDALDALILTLDAASITSLIKELHIPVGASVSDAAHRLIYKSGSPAATLPGGSSWSTSTGLAVTGAVLSAWTTADVAATSFAYSCGISGISWSSGASIAGAQDEADPYCYDWAGAVADKVVGNTLLYAGREASSTGESQIHNAGVRGLLLVSGLASTNFVLRDSEVLSHSPIAWAAFGTTESFQLPKRAGTLHCSHVSTGLTLAQARILSDALRTCCAALSAGRSLPAARATRVVWEGDSLTYGTRVSGLPYAAPLYAQVGTARSWGPDDAEQIEYGYPGQQLANMLAGTQIGPARADIDLTHRTGTPRAKRLHVFWLNTNDNIVGTSAATMKANLDTRVGQIKAEGGIPIVIGLLIRYAVSGVNQSGYETRAAAYHAAIAADTDYITAPTTWDGTKKAYFVALHTITALQNELDTSGGSATRYVDGVSSTVHLTEVGYGHIVSPLGAALDAALTLLLPAITSAATSSGVVSTAFSFSITATNSPTSYAVSGALPSGVTLNTSTGVLSGTPTVTGTFPISITATNGDGTGSAQSHTLTISPPPVPVFTSAAVSSGRISTAFSHQITATNSPTSFGATGLPVGLSLNTSTGLISGTLPASPGIYPIVLSAINAGGTTTQNFTLTITDIIMATPPHNLNALLIGTAEFSYAPGATSRANASAIGYIDIGNLTAHSLQGEGERKEHYGAYRGILRRDRTAKRKVQLSYKLSGDEFASKQFAMALMGTAGAANTRTAIAAVAGTAIVFSVGVPSVSTRWYDILDSTGVRVKWLTGVTITGKVEGTDFELDLVLGRVRFLTTQTASVTPTITAAAIVANDVNSFIRSVPLNQAIVRGYGRLVVFDESATQTMVLDHQDFSCEIEVDGETAISTDDWSKISYIVRVTSDVGVFDNREA